MNLRQRFRVITGRDIEPPAPQPPPQRAGNWNPSFIDLAADASDWTRLSPVEREFLLRLSALCQAGDEELALGLMPLLMVVSDEQRLEEELSLTSFLFEESKHVEMFRRFLTEVTDGAAEPARFRTIKYCRIVHDELPGALLRLRTDSTAVARAEASVVYNLVVLGMLAETAYHSFRTALDTRGIMPGMRRALDHLIEDTGQHLTQSVAGLARLAAEHGEPVREAIERRASQLREPARDILEEAFAACQRTPFGLDGDVMARTSADLLDRRCAEVLRAN